MGALGHVWMPEIADGCDISCLLIWQEIFSFHSQKDKDLNFNSAPFEFFASV